MAEAGYGIEASFDPPLDRFLLVGLIIVALIIMVYLVTVTVLHYWRNPTAATAVEPEGMHTPSTVTRANLGERGEMGNHMFQLACVLAAAHRSQAQVVLPPEVMQHPISDLCDLTGYTLGNPPVDAVFHEYDNYEAITIPADGRCYDISGYRQAYQYFEDSKDMIRERMRPRPSLVSAVAPTVPPQYIAVHIRMGDYIKPMHTIPMLREFTRCTIAYYAAAVQHIKKLYPDLPVLVCTNSPKLVGPLLSQIDPTAQLSTPVAGVRPQLYDFCVLYLASAVVMSNSTFSWWAAYLRPGRPVVAPSPWWDPAGFVGTAMGLDGPYLHYPEWGLLSPETGAIVRRPYSTEGERPDTNDDTLNIYRLFRGMIQ